MVFFVFGRKSAVSIDQDGRALLTDFASPSIAWGYQDVSKQTARWCAPEVLGNDSLSGIRPTFASDVFSYGMVVLEVTLVLPSQPR
jgi:serine/threonine protein kinase